MFKSLQSELRQTTLEKDELPDKLEQREACDSYDWENLVGHHNIEDPVNIISATKWNLVPPINIIKYYRAFKPLILRENDLIDIRPRRKISKEQF